MSEEMLLTAAAVIPAIILLVYVYRQDKIEREPAGLILFLIIGGMIAAGLSIIGETVSEMLILYVHKTVSFSAIVLYSLLALSVGIVEEFTKYLSLRVISWKRKAFDYRFDGIVYAVAVSIGFAGLENVLYVIENGFGIAALRAFTSLPGHTAFAILMGLFYGRAKVCSARGDGAGSFRNKLLAIAVPSLLHGVFDGALMIGTGASVITFFVILMLVYIVLFRVLKKEAVRDILVNPVNTENTIIVEDIENSL